MIIKKTLLILACSFVLMSCATAQTDSSRLPILGGIVFSTSSSIISGSNGCYTVQVNVYLQDGDDTKWLVASGNVQIGNCGRIISNNTLCEDGLYKEDYIINSDSKSFKYCLIDCLKDDRVYTLYQADKYRILSEIKK